MINLEPRLPLLQAALSAAAQPSPGLAVGAAVNSTVYLLGLTVLLAGLTPAAVAHSWLLGTLVYAAFGPSGYLLVCLYFVVGSAVWHRQIPLERGNVIL